MNWKLSTEAAINIARHQSSSKSEFRPLNSCFKIWKKHCIVRIWVRLYVSESLSVAHSNSTLRFSDFALRGLKWTPLFHVPQAVSGQQIVILFRVRSQDLANPRHKFTEARPVIRAVHPAVRHDSVHLQWAVLRLFHTVPLPQVVQQLLRGHAGVWTSSQSEYLPQKNPERPAAERKLHSGSGDI